MFKHIQTLVINSLLVVLLLGILVMPLTSLGLMAYKAPSQTQVLSAQDKQKDFQEQLEKERRYYRMMREIQRESSESTESSATRSISQTAPNAPRLQE